MPDKSSYDYAVIRVVPRVEREEFVNAGVILFSRVLKYLDARVELDDDRIFALFPEIDIDEVRCHLDLIPLICAGDPKGGPIASLERHERFHWLVAPRSTIIQTGPCHSGLTDDPRRSLEHLFNRLVAPARERDGKG